MKKLFKSIIAAVLCAVIVIASIGTNTAYAAKKTPLKVTFNGKSINLIKDMYSGDAPKIKELEKKWGEAGKKKLDTYYSEYTWKKGKTSIKITDHGDGYVGGVTVSVKDKNGAMCGIKVGMKKETALKKLQKLFGEEKVIIQTEGQSISVDENNNPVLEGEPTGDGEHILVCIGYAPFGPELKNGKVSSISFWMS